jgi:NTP pyrophosphatase (non-canonical NTP hydrolase)
MDFSVLLIKLNEIRSELKNRYPGLHQDTDKTRLARMVKLSEEVGELADEILSLQGLQRQEKMAAKMDDDLAKEFGDVFNSLMLLGLELDLDIQSAIVSRVDSMHQKYRPGK